MDTLDVNETLVQTCHKMQVGEMKSAIEHEVRLSVVWQDPK